MHGRRTSTVHCALVGQRGVRTLYATLPVACMHTRAYACTHNLHALAPLAATGRIRRQSSPWASSAGTSTHSGIPTCSNRGRQGGCSGRVVELRSCIQCTAHVLPLGARCERRDVMLPVRPPAIAREPHKQGTRQWCAPAMNCFLSTLLAEMHPLLPPALGCRDQDVQEDEVQWGPTTEMGAREGPAVLLSRCV